MFIAHRVNQLDETVAAEIFGAADGIEFDIRDTGGDIVVQHDPLFGWADLYRVLKVLSF